MISRKHKCIFIHIPKTAGTSIEKILFPPWPSRTSAAWAGGINMGFVDKYHNKYQTGGLQHLLADYVLIEVGDKLFFDYFKFAFVRNPWSKTVSQFFYLKKSRKDLREWLGVHKNVSFLEYLNAVLKAKVHVQWESQYKFVYDSDGKLLVDFIGRFETLQEDFNTVCDNIGMPRKKLPHENRSKSRKHYTEYYDDESRRIVAEKFAKDIEMFGYEFE